MEIIKALHYVEDYDGDCDYDVIIARNENNKIIWSYRYDDEYRGITSYFGTENGENPHEQTEEQYLNLRKYVSSFEEIDFDDDQWTDEQYDEMIADFTGFIMAYVESIG